MEMEIIVAPWAGMCEPLMNVLGIFLYKPYSYSFSIFIFTKNIKHIHIY